ncbi:MAG: hypothetical protein K5634_03510 [Sphaerochaetaceae bacterium]|nr:hypothetical protein [Sphaerochaetaceae bacterium]
MKRTLLLSVIILICASVFASSTIGVAFAGNYFTFKNLDGDACSTFGIGAGAAGEVEINEKLGLYADAGVYFPSSYKEGSVTITKEDLRTGLSDCTSVTASMFLTNANFGVFYRVVDNGPILFNAGGGLELESFAVKATGTKNYLTQGTKHRFINCGLSLYADARYMISDEFSVGLTVIPKMSLYSSITDTTIINSIYTYETKAGFSADFAVKAAITATYHFI